MVFTFIKFTQPAWQFNVKPKSYAHASCMYHPQYLPFQGLELELDKSFETQAGRYADLGYRAWNKGHLTWINKEIEQKIEALGSPSLKDEYTFLFKYWGKHWAVFALIQRLLTFHNPIKEFGAYWKSSGVLRVKPYLDPVQRGDYDNFQSPLLALQPLVAVIIPTLNRYPYLKNVMGDLEKQDYTNFEVIVVDQSSPFEADFYKNFKLKLNVIYQKERLLWTARNNAVRTTKADYLLFFDDDSRVDPDWITQHLKCLDYFKAQISAGVSLSVVGAKIPENYKFFRWADQFDSGNALLVRDVFKKVGMFDLNFNKQSMGDGEFGIRSYINGIKSISNPYAKRIHLKVPAGGLREIGHWDGFRPKKLFAPKPIPSVVYMLKKYFPKQLSRQAIMLGIMLSNVGFKNKRKNNMLVLSLFLTIVKSPLLLIQYYKSSSRAKAMLKGGHKIETLEGKPFVVSI